MEEEKKSGKTGLIITIIAAILLAGAAVYLFIDSRSKGREIEEMTQLFEIEKEEIISIITVLQFTFGSKVF